MSTITWETIDHNRELISKKLAHPKNYRVVVGMATCGISAGAQKVYNMMKLELERLGIKDVSISPTGCIGMCTYEPIVEVFQDGKEKVTYILMDIDKAQTVVEKHLKGDKPVVEYTLEGMILSKRQEIEKNVRQKIRHDYVQLKRKQIDDLIVTADYYGVDEALEKEDKAVEEALMSHPIFERLDQLPFYQSQERIVLKNCGYINPEDINEYIAVDGYQALKKVLTTMTPKDVIDTIKSSNLRGRGGGGFHTGIKWEAAFNNQADQKYFVCNADEGDPGAFMDRSLLEGDPHAILEAMAIGGYAIGAKEGFIYIRAEYPVAVQRLRIAIKQAKEAGLLGKNIMDSGFDFNIELRLGAGAFVCGEETALMASIEGKRGMPRSKPPYPAQKGLWGKPTIINNVETLANVPLIIRNGVDWFKSYGTAESPGTKIFALGGKINNTGLVEVPMGISLRDIIYKIGGGIPNDKEFKAVQTGGPSGGCISKENLDLEIDFDTLKATGSMMGSGGMIVMDEDNCMVDIARFYLDFIVDESCGKCVPCREGTKRLLEIIERITSGHSKIEDLDLIAELSEHIKTTALCGLGQTASNPVLSTIKHFKDEYLEHIVDKRCRAHVCTDLVGFVITDDCRGCTRCATLCPVKAISGARQEKHVIDMDICIRCGACIEGCAFNAIIRK